MDNAQRHHIGIVFDPYQDTSGEWRWRMVDGNNRIVGDSGEGYLTRQGVEKAIENVKADVHQLVENEKTAE